MSNYNLKAICKVIAELNLEGVQVIPMPSNPKCCMRIIYNGKEYTTSSWSKSDAEAFLSGLAEGCEGTYESDIEPTKFGSLFPLKNRPLSACLENYRDIHEHATSYFIRDEHDEVKPYNHYDMWIKMLFDGETVKSKEQAINLADDILNKKQCYLINNYVYPQFTLERLIREWIQENDYQEIDFNKIIEIIEKYQKAVNTRVSMV